MLITDASNSRAAPVDNFNQTDDGEWSSAAVEVGADHRTHLPGSFGAGGICRKRHGLSVCVGSLAQNAPASAN